MKNNNSIIISSDHNGLKLKKKFKKFFLQITILLTLGLTRLIKLITQIMLRN